MILSRQQETDRYLHRKTNLVEGTKLRIITINRGRSTFPLGTSVPLNPNDLIYILRVHLNFNSIYRLCKIHICTGYVINLKYILSLK